MTQTMGRVFISHSTLDREVVEEHIVTTLGADGIETWYSKHAISDAKDWEREILSGLNASEWFLIALSPRALLSPWVKDELHWAMGHRLGRILPVLLGDCDSLDFHLRLPRIQQIDFRRPSDEARRRLIEAIRATGSGEILANLDVVMLRKGQRARLSQALPGSGILPLRPGDLLRLEVSLSHPAYLYLLWIDGERLITPIYPWTNAQWDQRPEQEVPVSRLELPTGESNLGWPIQSGQLGLESVLMMVREAPLPAGADLRWLELPIEDQIVDPSVVFAVDARSRSPERGIDLKSPRLNEPISLRRHHNLLRRFATECQVLQVMTFSTASG